MPKQLICGIAAKQIQHAIILLMAFYTSNNSSRYPQPQYVAYFYPDKDKAFCRVMSKIRRGLFYHHMHYTLASNYKVETKKLEFMVPPGLWKSPDCYHCHPQIFRYGYTPVEDGEGWLWIINLLETRTFTIIMSQAKSESFFTSQLL